MRLVEPSRRRFHCVIRTLVGEFGGFGHGRTARGNDKVGRYFESSYAGWERDLLRDRASLSVMVSDLLCAMSLGGSLPFQPCTELHNHESINGYFRPGFEGLGSWGGRLQELPRTGLRISTYKGCACSRERSLRGVVG